MPRYFISVESPNYQAEDKQGEELPDDLAAHQAAQQIALELEGIYDNAVLVVRSENGEILTEVPIRTLPIKKWT